jgi:hypothetical protein
MLPSDIEKRQLQQLIKEISLLYETHRSSIEQAESAKVELRPLIKQATQKYKTTFLPESVVSLAIRDIEFNWAYLDSQKKQALAELNRVEPLQKQLEQLKPFFSNVLNDLFNYSDTFRSSLLKIDDSTLNLGLSIEPLVTKNVKKVGFQIFVKQLDDIDSLGLPIEEISGVAGLQNIISTVTMQDALDFYNYLTKYPMLGLGHIVGQKIRDSLKDIKLTTISNVLLYRGRVCKKKQTISHAEYEMFEAPYGKSDQQRFNIKGHGFLYAANKRKGAIKEIVNRQKRNLTIFEMKLNNKVDILDMASNSCPLFDFCQIPKSKASSFNHEYLVQNFVAQCCMKMGIEGIRYRSTKDPATFNYVFFDIKKSWFDTNITVEKYGQSR